MMISSTNGTVAVADYSELIGTASGIMLDIGCGAAKQAGWIGLDLRPLEGVDIVQDIEEQPWPLPDECVKVAQASHLIEHINPAKFGFVNFMNEVWRLMREGGQFWIVVPHGRSDGYLQDPTHCNPCNEHTWEYFDPRYPLYGIYTPRPWQIKALTYSPAANMEVVLEKLPADQPE